MKKVTRVEVSFIDDFVPFLRNFNCKISPIGRDVATIFYQESVNNLGEAGNPDAIHRVYERLSDIDPERWVSGSFTWTYSADGNAFWEDIDTKWRQFLSKEMVGKTEFIGEVTLSDIQSLIPESIQGKYYTVKELSYNRPVKEEFEDYVWNRYLGSELIETGGKYLILSDYPEDKRMSWISISYPRPMIKVWIPKFNKAWWVFFSPTHISTK